MVHAKVNELNIQYYAVTDTFNAREYEKIWQSVQPNAQHCTVHSHC